MANSKVIGTVEVSNGNVKFIDTDGNIREATENSYMFEGETIASADSSAFIQIKFLALPEASIYEGVFDILADDAVVLALDGAENISIDNLETASGEEVVNGSSAFLEETDASDTLSVLGFEKGLERGTDDTGYGVGITAYQVAEGSDQTPPIITSDNIVVFDENKQGSVLKMESTDSGVITYTISDLDSELFTIDSQTGEIVFIETPDYESPQDLDGDNEYNFNVTATDNTGNSTTQLISININNTNDNAPIVEGDTKIVTENEITGQIIGGDIDGNSIEYKLVDGPDEGTLVFKSDGSYTYNVGDNFQDLAKDETQEVTFTYKAVEALSGEGFQSELTEVTILVTGSDNGAVLSGTIEGMQAAITVEETLDLSEVPNIGINPIEVDPILDLGIEDVIDVGDGSTLIIDPSDEVASDNGESGDTPVETGNTQEPTQFRSADATLLIEIDDTVIIPHS